MIQFLIEIQYRKGNAETYKIGEIPNQSVMLNFINTSWWMWLVNSGADNCGELSVPLSLTIGLPYRLLITTKQGNKMIRFIDQPNGFDAVVEHGNVLIRKWGLTKEKAKESLLKEIKFLSEKEISVVLECHNNSSSCDDCLITIPFHSYDLIQNALNRGKLQIENLDHLI